MSHEYPKNGISGRFCPIKNGISDNFMPEIYGISDKNIDYRRGIGCFAEAGDVRVIYLNEKPTLLSAFRSNVAGKSRKLSIEYRKKDSNSSPVTDAQSAS